MKEPRNQFELSLWRKLQAEGWQVFRNGWPDIIATKGDRVAVFEVKPKRSERLKAEQIHCLALLSRGNTECYRWDEDEGFAPYSETLPDVKALSDLAERRERSKAQRICPICRKAKGKAALTCPECDGKPTPKKLNL